MPLRTRVQVVYIACLAPELETIETNEKWQRVSEQRLRTLLTFTFSTPFASAVAGVILSVQALLVSNDKLEKLTCRDSGASAWSSDPCQIR